VNQLEYDTLKILAGAYRIEAMNPNYSDGEKRMAKRHADEIEELIRNMRTEPAEPEGEPVRLPDMRWPSDRPTDLPEET
jgi:hypothetical protein